MRDISKYLVDVCYFEDTLIYHIRSSRDLYDRFTISMDIFNNYYQLTCSHHDFCNLAIL